MIDAAAPNVTTEALIDSLDFDLDLFGTANARNGIRYPTTSQLLKESKPPAPLTQFTNPVKPSAVTNVQK